MNRVRTFSLPLFIIGLPIRFSIHPLLSSLLFVLGPLDVIVHGHHQD